MIATIVRMMTTPMSACMRATEMPLEYREILQQRDHANHDDDHAHDLLGAGVKRKHVDKIKHEDNDEESDEHADEHVHARRSFWRVEISDRHSLRVFDPNASEALPSN